MVAASGWERPVANVWAIRVVALALAAPFIVGTTGLSTNLDARLLAAHNRERSAAGVPPLQWDDQLAADAAGWAETLVETNQFEHSDDDDDDPQGENLWLGTKAYYPPEAMVGMWIEEKKDFRPGAFPAVSRTGNYEDVGHYTQLMWRDTGSVGCAVRTGEEYDILVCRYRHAGNVEGERVF
ncbi:MAG: SCP-like extracellular [Alphaproteobacteria bacterium]|nr:MAG: SCP-like extracellular [Alphaproteobacteria bacterium]